MTIQSEAIRAAVFTLPERFNAAEVCDQLPTVPRQCISSVLSTMQHQGLLADDGSETLLHVSAKLRTQRITVRRFRKTGVCPPPARSAASPGAPRAAVERTRESIVNWDQGSRLLAQALAGWPGSSSLKESS